MANGTLAQFIPAQSPGAVSAAAFAGQEAGMSLLERSQSMRMRQQQEERAKRAEEIAATEHAIFAPVLRAKAKADVVEISSRVSGLEQAETVREAAQALLPELRSSFDSILLLGSAEERQKAGWDWANRYSQFKVLSDGIGAEVAQKLELIASWDGEANLIRRKLVDTEQAIRLEQARGEEARRTAHVTGRGLTVEQKLVRDREAALAAGDSATAEEIDRFLARRSYIPPASKAEAYRRELEDARRAGDAEAVALYEAMLAKEKAAPFGNAEGSAQLLQKLEEARSRGDAEEIQFWQKRINALNQRGVKSTATGSSAIDAALGFGSTEPTGERRSDSAISSAPSLRF